MRRVALLLLVVVCLLPTAVSASDARGSAPTAVSGEALVLWRNSSVDVVVHSPSTLRLVDDWVRRLPSEIPAPPGGQFERSYQNVSIPAGAVISSSPVGLVLAFGSAAISATGGWSASTVDTLTLESSHAFERGNSLRYYEYRVDNGIRLIPVGGDTNVTSTRWAYWWGTELSVSFGGRSSTFATGEWITSEPVTQIEHHVFATLDTSSFSMQGVASDAFFGSMLITSQGETWISNGVAPVRLEPGSYSVLPSGDELRFLGAAVPAPSSPAPWFVAFAVLSTFAGAAVYSWPTRRRLLRRAARALAAGNQSRARRSLRRVLRRR